MGRDWYTVGETEARRWQVPGPKSVHDVRPGKDPGLSQQPPHRPGILLGEIATSFSPKHFSWKEPTGFCF